MKITVFLLPLFLFSAAALKVQGQEVTTSRWPSFVFKVTASANMYFGLKNSNSVKILKTPPNIGPELQLQTGLRINDKASLLSGISLSAMPISFSFNFGGENIYAPDGFADFQLREYFIGLTLYSIPLSFEYAIPIKKSKHHVITELGAVANYNTNSSYLYDVSYSYAGQPDIFNLYLQDNNGITWFPSGFLRIGYMKGFKRTGAFSASFRLSLSGANLGRGAYSFNGFVTETKGDLKLPANSFSFDFAYHFRHTRKK